MPFSLRSRALIATVVPALFAAIPSVALAKPYKGAEVYTVTPYLYGRVEMRMRMIRGSGLLSTFFTYKDGSEKSGALWEEIDIEILGKDDAKSWQSNIITGNPRETSEQLHPQAASLADAYHTYALEWTPAYVAWSLDGEEQRRTTGGQAAALVNAESLRFNVWSSESTAWVGAFDEAVLPQSQFINWIKYYRYENGSFVLDWTDDFNTLDTTRWGMGDWSFDTNRVDFSPFNVDVKDGTLILSITGEDSMGFKGQVPVDPGSGSGGKGSGGTGTLGLGGATGQLAGAAGASAGGGGAVPASGGVGGTSKAGLGGSVSGASGVTSSSGASDSGCSCAIPTQPARNRSWLVLAGAMVGVAVARSGRRKRDVF